MNPLPNIIDKIKQFTTKWSAELDTFHPNIKQWLNDIEDSQPGKAKGLIKCHKPSNESGKKPYRLLLTGTNTPVQPLSKLVQDAISHLVPKLHHKFKDTKAVHQVIQKLNKTWSCLLYTSDAADE